MEEINLKVSTANEERTLTVVGARPEEVDWKEVKDTFAQYGLTVETEAA